MMVSTMASKMKCIQFCELNPRVTRTACYAPVMVWQFVADLPQAVDDGALFHEVWLHDEPGYYAVRDRDRQLLWTGGTKGILEATVRAYRGHLDTDGIEVADANRLCIAPKANANVATFEATR
jgi:hypothetical protein